MTKAEELLKKAQDALQKAVEQKNLKRLEEDRKFIVAQIGQDLPRLLAPLLEKIAENSKVNQRQIQEAVTSAIRNTRLNIDVPAPIVNVPDVYVPDIKVPDVKVNYAPPNIRIPDIKMPDEMNVKGWIGFMGYDKGLLLNPLPVQLRDASGNPVKLFENLTTLISQGGGAGKSDFFTIKGFGQSAFSQITNPDGRIKVELPSGSSGLTDSELRASGVPVAQVSGALWSVAVKEIFGSLITSLLNGDNRIPVSVETGGSGLTDSELRAAAIFIEQVSGAAWSVYVKEIFGSTAANVINPDGRIKVELPSGASGLTDTELRASHLDVQQVSGAVDSVAVIGSIETKQVSGFSDSVFITGFADSSIVYEVMTTNKTAKADGADIRPKTDDLGRTLNRPIQVRDLVKTAYATLSTNSETTLLAGSSGVFRDLIFIKFSNTSSGAVTIDVRETTGGTIIDTWEIPANASQGFALPTPYVQANVGGSWTLDYNDSDLSNTTVYVSALFSEEI